MNFFLGLVLLFLILQILFFIGKIFHLVYKYYFLSEVNFPQRYGKNTWALITGSSSGQGKEFALQFAKRGFHIILTGSLRNSIVEKEIRRIYPLTKVHTITCNFCNAWEDSFFEPFEEAFKQYDIGILVNNVGHRTAWKPYHEMPVDKIYGTIACGTIVQARLTQIAIPYFLKRKYTGLKSALINITAQCIHRNYGLGVWMSNEISVPYLSVYEACNAFGYYHSNSIYKEYGEDFDILTVTPGAVITENTDYLENTLFRTDKDSIVRNVLRMMGNINGATCADIKHEMAEFLVGIAPFMKDNQLEKVGNTIARDYMDKGINKKY